MVGSMPHGAWLGIFERVKLRHFAGRLRRGMTVWDIGANAGLYSMVGARWVGATGRVYAFEPMSRNLEYLRRHLALNRLSNVTVVSKAVADVSGALRMAEGNSPSEFHADLRGESEASAVRLDDWWKEAGSALPDIVKIDVEGGEDAVLRGGASVFSACRPLIYVAIHGNRQREECGRFLTKRGYRIESLEKDCGPEISSEWFAEPNVSATQQILK